jgi:hypothetical protein
MVVKFCFLIHILLLAQIPRGLTVRIAGFHPAGPGSTPGVGTFLRQIKLDCDLIPGSNTKMTGGHEAALRSGPSFIWSPFSKEAEL